MHTLRVLLGLLCAVGLLVPAGAQLRQPPPYRILVTNDDGVRAPGIAAIAQILQAIGTPIIVAPADNQSGKGHSIITTEPVFREDLTLPNGLRAIGLTATPASTVNIALRNIVMPRPDLVVAGINRGHNLGLSPYVSGTVSAAREATIHGVPAIAASLSASATTPDLVFAAEEVFGVARRVKQYGLPPEHLPQHQCARRRSGRRLQGLLDYLSGDGSRRRGKLRGDEAPGRPHRVLEPVYGRHERAAAPGHGHLGGREWLYVSHADACWRDGSKSDGCAQGDLQVGRCMCQSVSRS